MSSGSAPPSKVRQVACPTCAQPSLFAAENRWRPFCSQRCAGVDFGAWASEGYRVGVHASADAADPDEPKPPAH